MLTILLFVSKLKDVIDLLLVVGLRGTDRDPLWILSDRINKAYIGLPDWQSKLFICQFINIVHNFINIIFTDFELQVIFIIIIELLCVLKDCFIIITVSARFLKRSNRPTVLLSRNFIPTTFSFPSLRLLTCLQLIPFVKSAVDDSNMLNLIGLYFGNALN